MQMGIHRLALVLILGAEAHVGYFSPFAGQGFAITVFHGVEAMLFDGLEQADGICQRFIIARGTSIFTQPRRWRNPKRKSASWYRADCLYSRETSKLRQIHCRRNGR